MARSGLVGELQLFFEPVEIKINRLRQQNKELQKTLDKWHTSYLVQKSLAESINHQFLEEKYRNIFAGADQKSPQNNLSSSSSAEDAALPVPAPVGDNSIFGKLKRQNQDLRDNINKWSGFYLEELKKTGELQCRLAEMRNLNRMAASSAAAGAASSGSSIFSHSASASSSSSSTHTQSESAPKPKL